MSPEAAFGEVLRRHRLRAGRSQEWLAGAAGLDRTYISLLERGLRKPTLNTVLKLAHALDATASEMVREVVTRLEGQED